MKRPSRMLPLTLLALLSACSDQGPEDLLTIQLDAANALWLSSRPGHYAYTVRHLCDCAPEEAGPVRVEVDGPVAVSRRYDSGDAVPTELAPLFPTVDDLFLLLRQAIEGGAYEVHATYDADAGYPLTVRIDYEAIEFGEEAQFRTEAPPTPVPATLAAGAGV